MWGWSRVLFTRHCIRCLWSVWTSTRPSAVCGQLGCGVVRTVTVSCLNLTRQLSFYERFIMEGAESDVLFADAKHDYLPELTAIKEKSSDASTDTPQTVLASDVLQKVTDLVTSDPQKYVNPAERVPMETTTITTTTSMDTDDLEATTSNIVSDDQTTSQNEEEEAEDIVPETKNKKKKNKSQQKRAKKKKTGAGESKKSKSPPPNFFLAIQITNPEIHRGIEAIQKDIADKKSVLTSALIPLCTLHLTLMVLHLEDKEAIDRVRECLDSCRAPISEITSQPITMHLSGVGDFNNKVVFAKLEEDSELEKVRAITEHIKSALKERDIEPTDKRDFAPHITLLKLSRDIKLRRKGVKKVDPELYSSYLTQDFGHQTAMCVQLCKMHRETDSSYYEIHHKIPLVPEDYEELENMNLVLESDIGQQGEKEELTENQEEQVPSEDLTEEKVPQSLTEEDGQSSNDACSTQDVTMHGTEGDK